MEGLTNEPRPARSQGLCVRLALINGNSAPGERARPMVGRGRLRGRRIGARRALEERARMPVPDGADTRADER